MNPSPRNPVFRQQLRTSRSPPATLCFRGSAATWGEMSFSHASDLPALGASRPPQCSDWSGLYFDDTHLVRQGGELAYLLLQKEHGINDPYISYKISGTSLCNRGLRYVSMLSSLPRVLAGCSMCLSKAGTQYATDHGFASNEESAVEPSRITFYSSVAISTNRH
jgi:hypothetical protein